MMFGFDVTGELMECGGASPTSQMPFQVVPRTSASQCGAASERRTRDREVPGSKLANADFSLRQGN